MHRYKMGQDPSQWTPPADMAAQNNQGRNGQSYLGNGAHYSRQWAGNRSRRNKLEQSIPDTEVQSPANQDPGLEMKEAMQEQIRALEDMVSGLIVQIQKQENLISNFESQVQKQEDRISNLEGQVQRLGDMISGIVSQVQKLEDALNEKGQKPGIIPLEGGLATSTTG
ncbi:MAG: hypothetical protein ABFD18_20410 [Syntrophomonas sp.]